MAQLRRNHQTPKDSSTLLARLLLVAGVILIILFFAKDFVIAYFNNLGGTPITTQNTPKVEEDPYNLEGPDLSKVDSERPYLPTSTSNSIVNHDHYSLSYIEKYEQAEWVAYKLTKELLRKPNVPRSDYFDEDPLVLSKSATYYDYKGSGYSKGHLVPAADMAFSTEAMKQTFFMSNISPQLRGFNGGIWRELEEQTRDWAYHNDALYIVSGPLLPYGLEYTKKGIGIPKYFYKILLDNEGPERKAIAFLIPHEVSTEPLQNFVVTIDSIEAITGINFFYGLLSQKEESSLESNSDSTKWKFSDARYRLRVTSWNSQ